MARTPKPSQDPEFAIIPGTLKKGGVEVIHSVH